MKCAVLAITAIFCASANANINDVVPEGTNDAVGAWEDEPVTQLAQSDNPVKPNARDYFATFHKTGCPNTELRGTKQFTFWLQNSKEVVLDDMYALCLVNQKNKANKYQSDSCCGQGKTCQPHCVLQTSFSRPKSELPSKPKPPPTPVSTKKPHGTNPFTIIKKVYEAEHGPLPPPPPGSPVAGPTGDFTPSQAKFIATFTATGCPNHTPQMVSMPTFAWWEKHTAKPDLIFENMYMHCIVVSGGQATQRQKTFCCGEGVDCHPHCQQQNHFVGSAGSAPAPGTPAHGAPAPAHAGGLTRH